MNGKYSLLVALVLVIVGYILLSHTQLEGNVVIQCSDTDDGMNYDIFGSASIGSYTAADYCLNEQDIFEYYCGDVGISGTRYTCPGSCHDGACVSTPGSEIISCDDSDGGNNPLLYGEVTLLYSNRSQITVSLEGCSGAERVTEMSCTNNDYTLERVYCPEGTACTAGACS